MPKQKKPVKLQLHTRILQAVKHSIVQIWFQLTFESPLKHVYTCNPKNHSIKNGATNVKTVTPAQRAILHSTKNFVRSRSDTQANGAILYEIFGLEFENGACKRHHNQVNEKKWCIFLDYVY